MQQQQQQPFGRLKTLNRLQQPSSWGKKLPIHLLDLTLELMGVQSDLIRLTRLCMQSHLNDDPLGISETDVGVGSATYDSTCHP
jgi:hypothetical protein